MDSINKNQPEDNREDLTGQFATEKIKELIKQANTCFFCTAMNSGINFPTRPMSVQKVDDAGTLWFLSARDSHKNEEIRMNPDVRLFFQGSKHSDFLSLEGVAGITTDKAVIKKLWEPILKTWFTEGENDPRITAIFVEPRSGYYWDTRNGNLVAFVKQLAGAAIGKTLDDSLEGTLKP